MRFATALIAAFLTTCAADRPQGRCANFPNGYCHRRTKEDDEFVKLWNENKGLGNNSGSRKGNGPLLRRRLPEVLTTPEENSFNTFAPGEYEKVDGILLAFDQFGDLDVVAGIAEAVSRPKGAKVYMVANDKQKPAAERAFQKAGVNMGKVEWISESIDSVWIRDYGPRFICDSDFEGVSVRAAVDTFYYSKRLQDNNFPVKLGEPDKAPTFGHDNYSLNDEVLHSGGNTHYFSKNRVAFASKLLLHDNMKMNPNEEAERVEEALKRYWNDYFGVVLHLFDQLDDNVDATGHIDMWFLPVDDNKVIIGEWKEEDDYGSKDITDNAAKYMEDNGYEVFRVQNRNDVVEGYYVHYTYTNAVIVNDIVVISSFKKEAADLEALNVFQEAFGPDKTIVQVDSSSIIERSGALHCISQHVYACGDDTAEPSSTTLPTGTNPTCIPLGGDCAEEKDDPDESRTKIISGHTQIAVKPKQEVSHNGIIHDLKWFSMSSPMTPQSLSEQVRSKRGHSW